MGSGRIVLLSVLVLLPAFVVLLGLGTWQVQRLAWKQGLIEERELALAQAPAALPGRDLEVEGMVFRRVSVTGTFQHEDEFHLYAPKSGRPGYRVLTPLRQDAGTSLLIDRGWVSEEMRDPETRREGQIPGEVTVQGIVRNDIVGVQGAAPDNEPENNLWFWIDPAVMSEVHNTFYRDSLVVADDTPNPGGWPQGEAGLAPLRNTHLGYAITWYSLSLALVVIWGIALRRRLAGREKVPVADWGDDL